MGIESSGEFALVDRPRVFVKQVFEPWELVGFETRNKYRILDERGTQIAFAAEQQKGILGFLFRQYVGHWRKFDVHFFDADFHLHFVGHHPFRWFFSRIELRDAQGRSMGAIEKRFAFFTRRLSLEDEHGRTFLEGASPIWKPWTFTFTQRGQKRAEVKKKWSGLLTEAFTDRDNFLVEFIDPELTDAERNVVMASAIFIDLLYFEKKQ